MNSSIFLLFLIISFLEVVLSTQPTLLQTESPAGKVQGDVIQIVLFVHFDCTPTNSSMMFFFLEQSDFQGYGETDTFNSDLSIVPATTQFTGVLNARLDLSRTYLYSFTDGSQALPLDTCKAIIQIYTQTIYSMVTRVVMSVFFTILGIGLCTLVGFGCYRIKKENARLDALQAKPHSPLSTVCADWVT